MASLGIIIAVSNYSADVGQLPACSRDGVAMADMLRISGQFADILHIADDTSSTNVKQRLSEFVSQHRGEEIDQVAFYFTGHGEFVGDELYYLLTDYQPRRRRQTSLENREVDNIVRSLNPRLYVKIVDACHSGVTYIKSHDEFTTYLKAAQPTFDKLYFLFSSQSEQFSYQNNSISYFTESILKAVSGHGANTIRFKDVIDFVSDDFNANEFQTPFFVTQADFTEVFVSISPALRERLSNYIQVSSAPENLLIPQDLRLSIVERLRRDAGNYCSQDEAITILLHIPELLEATVAIAPDLAELYKVGVTVEKNAPSGVASIGKWLDQNKEERGYLAEPTFSTEPVNRRVLKRSLLHMGGIAASIIGGTRDEDYEWVTEHRRVISGYRVTFDVPYQHIQILFAPVLPNITPEECLIVPILSRTHVRLFWAFSHFEYAGWSEVRRLGTVEWSTADAPAKGGDQIRRIVSDIAKRFSAFVEEPLRAKWSQLPEPASQVDDGSDDSAKPDAAGAGSGPSVG
jgi:Caspase domain